VAEVALAEPRPPIKGIEGLRARLPRWEPAILLWLLLVAVLLLLVINPLLRLLITSFQETDTQFFTLANYGLVFGRLRNVTALLNSLLYGAAVTLVSICFAVPIAFAISRTDMPSKGFVRAVVVGAFITPSYLGAVAWILLAGPNAGWLNRAWMALTGSSSGPFDIYSFSGLVLVTALYAFPYVFVFTSDALDMVSSEMEEAAQILGAGRVLTTFKITLPLVTPAILAGAIVVFLDTIALFGTPAIIALPARINIMTLQLWQFFEFPPKAEAAAAYSMPLIGITCFLFWMQRLVLGRKSYVALTGKSPGRQLIKAGAFRWVLLGWSLFVCALAVLLPFAALGQAAFARAWGKGLSLSNLTLGNFHYLLFQHHNSQQTILNSFLYAGSAASVSVVLALGIAYVVSRRLVPVSGALTLLCMAPFVIPGIVLAIGFYAAYAPPPFALYGTAAILVLAYTTRFLPIAYVNCLAGLRAIHPEMEDAVRILGGSRIVALARVVAPLMKKGLVGSWILVFIPAVRELSTAIFLVAANTRVISVMLLDLSEDGNFETLAALGCVLLAATILIVVASYRMLGRDLLLKA
jgi:iron(III) transport system permease protein